MFDWLILIRLRPSMHNINHSFRLAGFITSTACGLHDCDAASLTVFFIPFDSHCRMSSTVDVNTGDAELDQLVRQWLALDQVWMGKSQEDRARERGQFALLLELCQSIL